MTPQEALAYIEEVIHYRHPRVPAAIATLSATLEQHRELESIVTDLVKWFTDPPDCPLFDLVNRARAYVGKEQIR